jgi:hypothetical protein
MGVDAFARRVRGDLREEYLNRLAQRASVRRHRRALQGCFWPSGSWIGFDADAPFRC